MAIGSGLGSQVGWSAESTYGTYVAPTSFTRFRSFNGTKTATRVQGEGIAAGAFGPYLSHWVETTTGGTATLAIDVQSKGMGKLFQALMGTSVTPVAQGASIAYLQTHTLADPYGKFLTVQGSLPLRGGTPTPTNLLGTKVTGCDLSCSVDGLLSASFDLDSRAYENTTSLASASYLSSNVFHGAQMAVKLGAAGSESAVTAGVRSVNVSIKRPMSTDDVYAGASGLKAEPVLNAYADITGSVEADFTAVADWHNRARDNTTTSLVWEFVGPLIASTYYETFRVTLPGIKFTSPDLQGVDGTDVLSNTYNFAWAYDGTNLPKIELISSDATLL
jgi:hypothetical protein